VQRADAISNAAGSQAIDGPSRLDLGAIGDGKTRRAFRSAMDDDALFPRHDYRGDDVC
jgi:hypothetical protein